MKTLIVGAGGLLGGYLIMAFRRHGIQTLTISRTEGDHKIDAGKINALQRAIAAEKPDVVINAAKASLSTDECEKKREEAWRGNVIIPENLARLQKKYGYLLVHVSSDWVYEGKENETYNEESLPYPQNFYAYTKAISEERVRLLAEKPLIIRTTGLFGVENRRANFFMRLMDSVRDGKTVSAAKDQYSQPIYAGELAELIRKLVEKKATGTYNAVSREYISRYELAHLFCDEFGWDKKTVVSQETRERAIRIPKHLKVDIGKILQEAGTIASLKDQVKMLKKEVDTNDRRIL